MGKYEIDKAFNRYIVVEPYEKSTVLQTEETATVFKVISHGIPYDVDKGSFVSLEGDLIIVAPNCVEKTMMGDKEVHYIRDADVIAVIKDA